MIWIKRKFISWRVKQGLKLLRNFDEMMRRAGVSRQERRYLWREVSKDGDARAKENETKIL